jgi:hypothetical protein
MTQYIVKGVKLHPPITEERVVDAARRHHTTLDKPGFCLARVMARSPVGHG